MSGSAGGSSAAASGGPPPWTLRGFLLSPLDPVTWRAVAALVLGFGIAAAAINALALCFSVGGSLLIVLVGIPLIALGIEACRLFARVERWRMTFADGQASRPHAYRQLDGPPRSPYGPWLRGWAEAEFLDPNRWRDVIYVLVLFPIATLELALAIGLWMMAVGLVTLPVMLAVLGPTGPDVLWRALGIDGSGAVVVVAIGAIAVGLALTPVAAVVSRAMITLHRSAVEALLCVSPAEALREDVERLRESRSAAVELEAAELRRIERDLHDGAQQRLVMLAIDLSMAEQRIDADPASARALVVDAREQARLALAELRDLVRGTAPSILVDRGLAPAAASLAGRCPVATVLDSSLAAGERLPPAVERAAYFVIAEALANVARHSSATHCEVALRRSPAGLVVEVRDDGAGGALISPGGGLAGLRDRVETLDGSLSVVSPVGGPTVLRVELPTEPG
jgi:signal transduction histidine kinase